ncbi:MgtC/SapB family protein [Dyella sp. RRB7]|uniref:MgtC/SapB family protein n=1 Tax=Dyella sp. RRB7 TaxID=2919502 RepID=UPI001FA9AEC8|nr:MgtC/SapB family protein [Dyella sp. RRB7]
MRVSDVISFYETVLRLLAAALCGAVIGVNRSRLEWAAGMRTHMLVSLAIIVSAYGFQHALTYEHVVLDPSRIAAQVISGIGFLGAGTILFLQREQVVRGLTTAAGLWAVAAVGLAAGAGLFAAAFTTTAILWIILALLKPLEHRFVRPRGQHTGIMIELGSGATLAAIEHVLDDFHVPIRQMRLRRAPDGLDSVDVRFALQVDSAKLTDMADACRKVDGVTQVQITLPGRQP